jgi:hypothetical protein
MFLEIDEDYAKAVIMIHVRNFHKVKNHASLRKGGSHEIHDIEDLVTIAKSVRGNLVSIFMVLLCSGCA